MAEKPTCPRCGRGEQQKRSGFCKECTDQHKAIRAWETEHGVRHSLNKEKL